VEEKRVGLVLLLLREGSLWHAIKLYQEDVGVSFAVARERVVDLARTHGIRHRRRGFLPFVLIALAGLAGMLLGF